MNCKPYRDTQNIQNGFGWISHNYLFNGKFDIIEHERSKNQIKIKCGWCSNYVLLKIKIIKLYCVVLNLNLVSV